MVFKGVGHFQWVAICLTCLQVALGKSKILNVPGQLQEQSTWCWIVSDKMALDFRKTIPGYASVDPGTQCEMADRRLPGKDCCTNVSSCRVFNSSDPRVWEADYQKNTLPLSPEQIAAGIDANYPFTFSWTLESHYTHYMVGMGYDYDGAVIYYRTGMDTDQWGMWFSDYVEYNFEKKSDACLNWR